jgi:hypothetical protein
LFTANGIPILADEEEVLVELREQLAMNGIYRFHTIRKIQDHIQFSCPIHKGGQEMKPSCGITTRDIKQGDKLIKAGTVHCFTCGYVASLEEMISTLFGKEDMGVFGIEWLKRNFLTVQYDNRPELKFDFERNKSKEEKELKYVSEEELDSYRYIHPYAYKRRLTDDIIDFFDVGFDDSFIITSKDGKEYKYQCLTFPVRDITGGTLFVARRSVTSKFFYYPNGVEKPVYGVYELSKIVPYPNEIIICESMLNCLTCWVYGKYAVALNGTGTQQQIEQLRKLPCRKFILGLDPDDAGNRGREKLKKALKKDKLLSEYIIPVGKDINDLSKEEFDNLQEVIC